MWRMSIRSLARGVHRTGSLRPSSSARANGACSNFTKNSVGYIFGELASLKPGYHRTQSVECVESGHVLALPYDEVRARHFEKPEFGFYFLIWRAVRLRPRAMNLKVLPLQPEARSDLQIQRPHCERCQRPFDSEVRSRGAVAYASFGIATRRSRITSVACSRRPRSPRWLPAGTAATGPKPL
jgi:hypothetical protein